METTKEGEEVDGGVPRPPPRQFKYPVDSDHKSKVLNIFSFNAPHMRAFQLAWFSFFASFVSTFAAAPLIPLIRDNLNLTSIDIGNAGIASVSGAVFVRLVMGTACDLVGPRLATATLVILTSPAVFCTAIIDSPASFLAARFLTGFSLASFVSNQFWTSSMFSTTKVGMANGFAAGWGNLGGGATQLIMPLVYEAIVKAGSTKFTAWRIAFFIPGVIQVASGIAVVRLGEDMPDGNYRKLRKQGDMHKDKFSKVFFHAIKNYRSWILALGYGYCFGVELTVDNIIAEYFFDRFHLDLRTAGIIAASSGLANIFSRPSGGWLSDVVSKRFGMRGRLWSLFLVQSLGGVFCVVLGLVDSLPASIVILVIFSIFVQAACGFTFGVVPFVSRRALGLVSGMTGAGGNVGAVLTQLIFFRGTTYAKEDGILYMGIMIIACTLPMLFIYFPQWGGMFTGPSANTTEHEYYMSEWGEDEKEKSYHLSSLKFADTSRSERGKGKGSLTEPTTLDDDSTPAQQKV